MPGQRLLGHGLRGYATAAATRRPRLKSALSLDHFIQRQRALSLYRSIIRGTRRISDPDTRFESARYARDEFERHRRVTDLDHIRFLLSTGKAEWDNMEKYLRGA